MDAQARHSAALLPTAAVVVLLLALTGCGGAAEPATTGVAFCQSPAGDLGPSDMLEVEMHQGDDVVGGSTVRAGTAIGFQVPVGRRTDVYVDGELRGSAGEDDVDPDDGVEEAPGGWVYLAGEGCPEEPPTG